MIPWNSPERTELETTLFFKKDKDKDALPLPVRPVGRAAAPKKEIKPPIELDLESEADEGILPKDWPFS